MKLAWLRRLSPLALLACASTPQEPTEPSQVRPQQQRSQVASTPTSPIPAPQGPDCDGVDLDVVAACIVQALSIVQRDPEDGAFGSLLAEAARTGGLDPVCARLPGVRTGATLTSAGGKPLAVDVTSSSWDHLDDGAARRYLDHRVSCDCCREVATFTVVQTVGGP